MTTPPITKSDKSAAPGAENVSTARIIANKSVWFYLSIVVAAVGFACVNRYHVSTMFENDRHFSHLSTMEREMSFFSEMGLYYFYFKTLVEAPSFSQGFYEVTHNNLTEYPKVINTLQRFNLLPEVLVSGLYRMFIEVSNYFDLTTESCWQVSDGRQSRSILSCEGLGVPVYFYLEAVWFCAGLTAGVLFVYGVFLSDSFMGGLLSVGCFFFNHSECTRVQWTPPLRESFGYPFLLLQMLLISRFLKSSHKDVNMKKEVLFTHVKHISLVTCLCHLLWQFSSFVMATQMGCIIFMYCIGNIKRSTFFSILACQTSAVLTALFILWGNELLFGSVLTLVLASSWLSLLLEIQLPIRSESIRRLCAFVIGVPSTFLLLRFRQDILGSKQDTHVFNIFLNKILGYKDFHTLLYTCAPEFDVLPLSVLINITETGLLPAAVAALMFLFCSWATTLLEPDSPKRQKVGVKDSSKKEPPVNVKEALQLRQSSGLDKLEPQLLYHVLQLIVFMNSAVLIMRLKLFFTPHLCLTVALLASGKMARCFRKRDVHIAVVAVIFSMMSFKGFHNLEQQRSIVGEYSNAHMEEMLTWVKQSTHSEAVFAGPMAVMATLLLSTKRPVVNHPHYEDFELRERTKAVYSIYSNKPPLEVYETLSSLGVNYVVVDISYCQRSSRKNCTMEYLWSIEDPENAGNPSLCRLLSSGDPVPFKRVFGNPRFRILHVPSRSVEYKPISSSTT